MRKSNKQAVKAAVLPRLMKVTLGALLIYAMIMLLFITEFDFPWLPALGMLLGLSGMYLCISAMKLTNNINMLDDVIPTVYGLLLCVGFFATLGV